MLLYFILFSGIGLAIGKLVNDRKMALGIILGIAVLWGMGNRAIWGFVTLGELLLGYFLFDVFLRDKNGGDGGEFQLLSLQETIVAPHIALHPCDDYNIARPSLFK